MVLTAEEWRERAAESRSIAERMSDPSAREMMRRIAGDYERFAKWAEATEAATAVVKKT